MYVSLAPFGSELLFGQRLVLEKVEAKHAEFLQACYSNDEFMDCYRLTQDRKCGLEQIKERLLVEQSAPPQKMKRIEWVIT